MDNGLPALLGDRAPAFQQEIQQYGGCTSDINLAYYYPVSKEVVYIGHVYQMGLTQSFDSIEVMTNRGIARFRGRKRPTEVDLNIYVTPSLIRGVQHIVDRYCDPLHSFSYEDIVGTLIGYFDLANGDQFRFMFPRFLLTRYETRFDFTQAEGDRPIQMDMNGSFYQGSTDDISYMRIEETKKIDYKEVKMLESL